MRIVKALVRVFSYLFHTLLTLFLIGVSGLALVSGSSSLHLEVLPWQGATLVYALFCAGLFGLITVILAIRGKYRSLFFLWSLIAFVLLVKGYIFSGYHFATGEAGTALYLMGGSLIALAGAGFQLGNRPRDRRLR